MQDHNVNFHIAEYNSLRTEILYHSKSSVNSLTYSVTANAATLGFLISNMQNAEKYSVLLIIATWVPTVFTVIGWTHYYESIRNIQRIATYCKQLEEKFALRDFNLGWESKLTSIRGIFTFRSRYLYNTVFALQMGLAIYLGLFMTKKLFG